mmetsp:Transcript_37900/g.105458  ORF Transcript_37900/g.105458 Transcript_37900/m.105458 type:complete len:403 (+) Transcript_37900:399-1607(+)
MFVAEVLYPDLVHPIDIVARMHNKPLHMFCEIYLSVDLGLLVLHGAHSRGVSEHGGVLGVCHVQRLLELHVRVLVEHVRVEVQHREAIGLEVRGVLRREGAPQAHVLEDQVRVAVLGALHDTSVVVHDVLYAILAAVEGFGLVVATAKEVLLPLGPDLGLQEATGSLGLELVPVMRILLHELEHLVDIHVHDNRGQLADPCQRHPQILVLETHAQDALLHLWQSIPVVLLGQASDVRERVLLALHQAASGPKFRWTHDESPVGLRIVVDARLLQRQLQVLGSLALGEAPSLGDHLSALLEELHAAAHPSDVLAELAEGDEASGVGVDGLHKLVYVRVLVRETQVGAHGLHVPAVELAPASVVKALVGGGQRLFLRLEFKLDSVKHVLGIATARLDRFAHILD